jgi:hypothetical protein
MTDFGSDVWLTWLLGICTGFVFGVGFVQMLEFVSEWRERNRERDTFWNTYYRNKKTSRFQ